MSENLIKIQIVKTFHPLLAKGDFFEFLEAFFAENIEPVNCHISDGSESENPVGAFTIKGQREDEQDASISIETNIPQDKTKDEFYEQYFRNLSNHFKNHPAGSTAVVTNIDSKNDEITVYNVGDSESYLLMEYNGEIKTILLTRHHNIESEESIKELPENVGVHHFKKRICAFKKNDSNKGNYVRCSLVNETEIGDRKLVFNSDKTPLKNEKGMVYCLDDNGKYYIKTKDGKGKYNTDSVRGLNVLNTIGDNGITNTWVDKTKFDLRSIAKEVFGENVDPEEIQFGTINCCDGFSEGATGYCCDYKIEKNGTLTPINEEDIDPQRNISNLKKIFNEKSNNIDNKFEGSFEKYLVMSAFHGSDLQDVINKDGEIELEVKESDYPEFKELYYRGNFIGYVTHKNGEITGNKISSEEDEGVFKPTLEFNIIPNVEEQKSYNWKKSNDNITTVFYSFKLKTLESKTIGVFDGHGTRGEEVSESAAFYLHAIMKDYSYSKEDVSEEKFKRIAFLLMKLLSSENPKESSYASQILLDNYNKISLTENAAEIEDEFANYLLKNNANSEDHRVSFVLLNYSKDPEIKNNAADKLLGFLSNCMKIPKDENKNLSLITIVKEIDEKEGLKCLEEIMEKIDDKEKRLYAARMTLENFDNYEDRKSALITIAETTDDDNERFDCLNEIIKKSGDDNERFDCLNEIIKKIGDKEKRLYAARITLKDFDNYGDRSLSLTTIANETDDEKERLDCLEEIVKNSNDYKEILSALQKIEEKSENPEQKKSASLRILKNIASNDDDVEKRVKALKKIVDANLSNTNENQVLSNSRNHLAKTSNYKDRLRLTHLWKVVESSPIEEERLLCLKEISEEKAYKEMLVRDSTNNRVDALIMIVEKFSYKQEILLAAKTLLEITTNKERRRDLLITIVDLTSSGKEEYILFSRMLLDEDISDETSLVVLGNIAIEINSKLKDKDEKLLMAIKTVYNNTDPEARLGAFRILIESPIEEERLLYLEMLAKESHNEEEKMRCLKTIRDTTPYKQQKILALKKIAETTRDEKEKFLTLRELAETVQDKKERSDYLQKILKETSDMDDRSFAIGKLIQNGHFADLTKLKGEENWKCIEKHISSLLGDIEDVVKSKAIHDEKYNNFFIGLKSLLETLLIEQNQNKTNIKPLPKKSVKTYNFLIKNISSKIKNYKKTKDKNNIVVPKEWLEKLENFNKGPKQKIVLTSVKNLDNSSVQNQL